jgi:hypothetical protein
MTGTSAWGAIIKLRDNYNDPHWWRLQAYSFANRIQSIYPGDKGSVDVMAEDWDNLIILDACRADLFEEVVDLEQFDEYRTVTSPASMTPEWVEVNFAEQEFGDTVYVTSNPYVSKLAGDSFHDLRECYHDGFDPEYRTVLPETITDAALAERNRYPKKRLVVHYMQPHHPFVGDGDLQKFSNWDLRELVNDKSVKGINDPFEALEYGLVDRERVWQAYRENLDIVIQDVSNLISELPGRTIVTSDHGNLVGDFVWPVPVRGYGHPKGLRSTALTEVPWAIMEGSRIDTTNEGTNNSGQVDDDIVNDRLGALGYT